MQYAKSTQTKQKIISCAREVFSRRGFAKVTMKDIVEACGISRGGLYRYFGSTAEIFLAVFVDDASREKERIQAAMEENLSSEKLLTDLIVESCFGEYGEKSTIALAAYEFFIENEDEQIIRRWQFDGLAETIRELIADGIEKGFFNAVDAAAWGRHIACFITGFQLTFPILQLPKQRIDEEIALLLAPLMKRDA